MKDRPTLNHPHLLNPDMQPPLQWEPPAILLERSLIIHAQQGIGGMGDTPMDWIGPLNGSGMDGICN